jgi:hypothetical protein
MFFADTELSFVAATAPMVSTATVGFTYRF